ncbi:MAG: hypothetical protein ACLVEF_05670 [Bifidobacterium bifidum]
MMASTLRTARSNAAPVAPAGRGSDGAARPAARPQLHVIDGSSQRNGSRPLPAAWLVSSPQTRARGASLIHVTVAIVFLVATLLITLMLRTQMVQNSFESNTVQKNINMLTQDVQDDQAKLDELISSLPDKAQKMGMVPQQDSVTIDLNGYKPSKGSAQ